MNEKEISSIIDDLNKIFPTMITNIKWRPHWVEIELAENIDVSSNDFPHLLTIAKNYGLHISVYSVDDNKLGIFLNDRGNKK